MRHYVYDEDHMIVTADEIDDGDEATPDEWRDFYGDQFVEDFEDARPVTRRVPA